MPEQKIHARQEWICGEPECRGMILSRQDDDTLCCENCGLHYEWEPGGFVAKAHTAECLCSHAL